ncbi:MAG: anti-sigma regulatory factor [Armatimonadetes bacterium]|nr:anti-sigma regulatory factor [Armatimonadota bacterium]
MAEAEPVMVPIQDELDIVRARQEGRQLAKDAGFGPVDLARVATAISELARNIYNYARPGTIELKKIQRGSRRGIQVVAQDHGPGIDNVEEAMRDGYTTSGGLGAGLPGTRRLVDEFEIVSRRNEGTTVTVRKWLR